MSGKQINMHFFLGFEPFLLSSDAEYLVVALNHKCRSKSLVQLTWLSEFELTELKQKKKRAENY